MRGITWTNRDTTSAAAWTPKFGVDFQIDERTLAYKSATRGYKSGGFNLTAREARGGFAPEWAWTYEAGIKSSPMHQRVPLNGAMYDMSRRWAKPMPALPQRHTKG